MNTINDSMRYSSNRTEAPNAPAKCRGLLALDGENLSPEQLIAAQMKCLQVADQVDILMVNPSRAPTSMLCELLSKLEQAGVDYRLTVTTGRLSDQIKSYIMRFLGIRLIMLSTLPTLGRNWRIDVADLRHQGYRIVSAQNSPTT